MQVRAEPFGDIMTALRGKLTPLLAVADARQSAARICVKIPPVPRERSPCVPNVTDAVVCSEKSSLDRAP